MSWKDDVTRSLESIKSDLDMMKREINAVAGDAKHDRARLLIECSAFWIDDVQRDISKAVDFIESLEEPTP